MKRILLVCAAGMSTSLLVTKMKKSAVEQDVEVYIEALSDSVAIKKIEEYDVVLLGPQVRFIKGKFDKVAKPLNVPVEVINMMDYGRMDGEKVLKFAFDLIK